MIKRLIGLCLAAGIGASASAVQAANCGQRDRVVERLEGQFSEQLTAGGLQSGPSAQAMLEIWTSTETGTFTVLLTRPDGLTCVVAAGTDFFDIAPQPQPEGAAS